MSLPAAKAAGGSVSFFDKKMTPAQATSLAAMRSCLMCHLCDQRFTEPATLMACMHSFCHKCILEYTEDNWYCPVNGCGAPVTCKGGSNEAIKKNPIISAVVSSFHNIEKIMETAPVHWWLDQNKIIEEGEDDVVVDFQMILENDKSRKRSCREGEEEEDDFANDNYDIMPCASIELNVEHNHTDDRNSISSINQSLFPLCEDKSIHPTLPDFACSPIAVQNSQADTTSSCTRSVTQQRLSTSSPPPPPPPPPSSRHPIIQSAPQQHPRRVSRVSFQSQPRVLLLNPASTLSSEHSRCLRKAVKDGALSILKMHPLSSLHSDATLDDFEEFDSGFNFDTEVGRQSFMDMLSSNRNDDCPPASWSFYAIGTDRDLNFSIGGVVIVPRTFNYYLSVACGLPIVDIAFLSSMAKNTKRQRDSSSHQQYLFPYLPAQDNTKAKQDMDSMHNNTGSDFLVLGASNYTWDAPRKAREAALHRYYEWKNQLGPHAKHDTLLPGTYLLHAFTIILVGEFDQRCHNQRSAHAKRKRQTVTNTAEFCTRGNICLLLQLCGAKVYNIDCLRSSKQIKKGLSKDQITEVRRAKFVGQNDNDSTTLEHDLNVCLGETPLDSQNSLLVMVRNESYLKVGKEFIAQINMKTGVVISVVSCQWLLDSIGEFEAKQI